MRPSERGKILRILSESPEMLSFVENMNPNEISKMILSNGPLQIPDSLLEEIHAGISKELKVDVVTGITKLLRYIVYLSPMELKIVLALAREKRRGQDGAERCAKSTD